MTLAFLGEVPADRADAAESAAASAAAELVGVTFQLRLNRLGYWRHNRILWAGTDSESAPLLALVDKLAAHLRDAGFALESRRFAAHVTLLRDAQCQDLPGLNAPIEWPVSDFVLAESQLSARGARYRVRHRWSLRTMPA